MATLTLTVNGRAQTVDVDPTTPLLYVRSDDLTRLGRLAVLGQVLGWHQDPQNVLTAVALGK